MTERAARVPLIAPKIATGEILNGVSVSGRTWNNMAQICNYMAGRGSTQVPAYYPGSTITAASNVDYLLRIAGTDAILTRAWFVRCRSASSTQSCEVTVTVGSDSITGTFTDARDSEPLVLLETVATPAAEGAITLNIAATTGLANAVVENIACYDVPRLSLEQGASPATKSVNADSLVPGTGIYEDGAGSGNSTQSIQGVVDALRFHQSTSSMPNPKRNHYQWAVPSADAEAITSAGFTTFIDHIHYLPKRILTGSSSTSIKFWAYAKVDSGSANIKYRSSTIDLNSVTVTSTSYAWHSSTYSIGTQEDLDEDDGRATVSGSPVWSNLNVQGRVTTATQLDVMSIMFMDNN